MQLGDTEELIRLRESLGYVMNPEFISQWLDTPNSSFNGASPMEIIERNETYRVWDLIPPEDKSFF